MTKTISGFKFNKPVTIELLHQRESFKRPKPHTRIDPARVLGVDTETLKSREYGDKERTVTVQVDHSDPTLNVILEAKDSDYPIKVLFDHLWPLFSTHEQKAAWTKQRPRRARGGEKPHRDGRRQTIDPVVIIIHNLEYDLGRLMRDHPQFKRAALAGDDNVRIMIDDYEVEIQFLIPFGSAPCFEFFIRRDHRVMRLIGRDLWGYIKSSLNAIGESLLQMGKAELAEGAFLGIYEDMSDEELEEFRTYAANDALLTRQAYELIITLLIDIEPLVIGPNGLPPVSAPGAAAKMAFSMASADTWNRPSCRVQEIGALTYHGALAFSHRPGFHKNTDGNDVNSMYPHGMTQLPDPCSVEYVDIEACKYIHERWRGKWGALCVSGEGLDSHFPALRVHDTENTRLRSVFGTFERIWTTIPEVVIGVQSGRLRIDRIHDGIEMVGSNEHSFLKKFVEMVYKIKKDSPKGSPMYLMAKLLLNALYGKLVEVNFERPHLEPLARVVPLPRSQNHAYDDLVHLYIDKGIGALQEASDELMLAHPDEQDDPVLFGDLFNQHHPKTGKAGYYYLSMYGAQITGFASAKLALAAHCTNAIQGDTDSLFTIGDASEGLARYREIMLAAGYDAPEHGLGAFELEVKNGSGYFVKNKVYAIRYVVVDKETGKKVEKEKVANHGLVHVNTKTDSYYQLIERLYKRGKVSYTPKEVPIPLKTSLARGIEPGLFTSGGKPPVQHKRRSRKIVQAHDDEPTLFDSQARKCVVSLDPNMEWNDQGERVWKPFTNADRARYSYSRKQIATSLKTAQRDEKNDLLHAHGFTWGKTGDTWVLRDKKGETVTELVAMQRIAELSKLVQSSA